MISPLPGIVYIRLEEPSAGALDTTSRGGALEYAEVLAVGEGVSLKVGDKIFVKSWGIDSVYHENQRYNFVSIQNGSILATVSDET